MWQPAAYSTLHVCACLCQVASDIKRLSKVKPKLPWSANDTGVRKPKAAAGRPGGGFGKKK